MANTLVGIPVVRDARPGAGAPEVPPGKVSRAILGFVDWLLGPELTYARFRAGELLARVPYQAWESVAYAAITDAYPDGALSTRLAERIAAARDHHDHEQQHVVWMETLVAMEGEPPERWRYQLVPRLLAHVLYVLAWLAHLFWPAWSYHLNAELEDRAERDYLRFVAEHPELEVRPSPIEGHRTLADLFRAMARDEREHKLDSLARCEALRSGSKIA